MYFANSFLTVYDNSIFLSSRDTSMLTLVLSHSLNSLEKILTFEHGKNKCFFLVDLYSSNILHYQFF